MNVFNFPFDITAWQILYQLYDWYTMYCLQNDKSKYQSVFYQMNEVETNQLSHVAFESASQDDLVSFDETKYHPTGWNKCQNRPNHPKWISSWQWIVHWMSFLNLATKNCSYFYSVPNKSISSVPIIPPFSKTNSKCSENVEKTFEKGKNVLWFCSFLAWQ